MKRKRSGWRRKCCLSVGGYEILSGDVRAVRFHCAKVVIERQRDVVEDVEDLYDLHQAAKQVDQPGVDQLEQAEHGECISDVTAR